MGNGGNLLAEEAAVVVVVAEGGGRHCLLMAKKIRHPHQGERERGERLEEVGWEQQGVLRTTGEKERDAL